MIEAPRRLFAISGEDHVAFLQNLITNDMAKLAHGPIYAGLLTPQGKYLADFLLVPHEGQLILDVSDAVADGLIARLSMYRLRSDVGIAPLDMPVSFGAGTAPAGAIADPRPGLGWRVYGQSLPADPGWTAARIAAMVPETGVELGPDSYILEMNFEALGGVDFRKGCYVGQEVTARMKHKTTLRKGLARVQVDGPADPGAEITAVGKPAGVLHSRVGDQALAYLRFDRMADGGMAGEAVVQVV